MDTLGIEPRASRMLSGCDTTTPCALLLLDACLAGVWPVPSRIAFCDTNPVCGKDAAKVTPVGFEPTPLRTGALSQRLRPLGQSVLALVAPHFLIRIHLLYLPAAVGKE